MRSLTNCTYTSPQVIVEGMIEGDNHRGRQRFETDASYSTLKRKAEERKDWRAVLTSLRAANLKRDVHKKGKQSL